MNCQPIRFNVISIIYQVLSRRAIKDCRNILTNWICFYVSTV